MPTSSRPNLSQSRQNTRRQASSRHNRKVGIRAGPVESPTRCPYDNEGRSASAVASRPECGSFTPVAVAAAPWPLRIASSSAATAASPSLRVLGPSEFVSMGHARPSAHPHAPCGQITPTELHIPALRRIHYRPKRSSDRGRYGTAERHEGSRLRTTVTAQARRRPRDVPTSGANRRPRHAGQVSPIEPNASL
jgi:hypothetical protein